MARWTSWRNFWLLWGGGLLILAVLLSQGDQLVTEIAPGGMVDHQTAGSAQRVNEIHESWEDNGRLDFFRTAILFDLLFIGMYSLGGIIGGRLVRRDAVSQNLKRLGLVAITALGLFGLLDYFETICQFIQVFVTGGNDGLAWSAGLVQAPKLFAFFVGTLALLAALLWLRFEPLAEGV